MDQFSLADYVNEVYEAWMDRNGLLLSELISLRDKHVFNNALNVEEDAIDARIDSPLYQIVSSHIKCIASLKNKDLKSAFENQNNLSQEIIKIFQKEENWMLPVVCSVCLDLRTVALSTEKSQSQNTAEAQNSRQLLEDVAEVLMSAFRICSGDGRSSDVESKKWGMMPIVNQLFKVYIKINKLYLMKPLVRTVDASPYLNRNSLSQLITYKYCVGRKSVYDGDYKRANEDLTFAFERCHASCKKNKRQILIYLVPTKILLGFMPVKEVLEKYNLLPFWDIAQAVKKGVSKEVVGAIALHEKFLTDAGIYLIVEKLRIIAYRNLFKKVYLIYKEHVITMEVLTTALQITESEDVDLEETHCILSNLINYGKVKGYISYTHQKVVLSKLDPFPKLSLL